MISVVIPAYNEEDSIGICLESLTKQKTNREFEVIVVNNASTDATVERVKAFEDRLRVRVIDEPKKGRGAARARGWSEAKGDSILSTDADTRFPNDWIDRLASRLESDLSIVGISGNVRIDDCGWLKNTFFNSIQVPFRLIYRLGLGHHLLPGFNFALRKEAYEKSGGFDPENNGQEDVDLSRKISTIGKVYFDAKTAVIFSGRRFHGGFMRGLLEYWKVFFHIILRGKTDVHLSDPR